MAVGRAVLLEQRHLPGEVGSPLSGFTEQQRASAYPPGIDAHFWLVGRSRILCDTMRRTGAASPVLDLGCGTGITVRHLRARGFECYGVDLAVYEPTSPELAGVLSYGQDALGLPLAWRSQFRTLLLLDVLEHILDPVDFVRRCVAAYPNLAHLVITLPARQELWSNYDEFYDHHRRYDRQSAVALCRAAGTEVIESAYFFHALYATMALQRLLSIERSVELSPIRHRRLHAVLAACFHLEAQWLPGAWLGSSLLVAARVRHAG